MGAFGSWTTSGATTTTFFIPDAPPPPACNRCGSHAVSKRTVPENLFWCARCFEIFQKEFAIKNASSWIEAAFVAVDKAARKKLYRALSAIFHPDVGGDAALMIALNQVNDRLG